MVAAGFVIFSLNNQKLKIFNKEPANKSPRGKKKSDVIPVLGYVPGSSKAHSRYLIQGIELIIK